MQNTAFLSRFSLPPLPFVPTLALVLGSGLGALADESSPLLSLDYNALGDGFPRSTVPYHRGRFVFTELCGVKTVIMQGRVHYYEGYTMQETVTPIRLMRAMGATTLILTNAAGGIRDDLVPGSLMLLSDHIASFVPSPLYGANDDTLGVRFPDMTCVYDEELRCMARGVAEREGIALTEGVYLQAGGPQYETPSEVRAFRTLGADAVGMSTACEAIAARHAGMRVLGISCITNRAAGLGSACLSHEEVKKTADVAKGTFKALVRGIVKEIGAQGNER